MFKSYEYVPFEYVIAQKLQLNKKKGKFYQNLISFDNFLTY